MHLCTIIYALVLSPPSNSDDSTATPTAVAVTRCRRLMTLLSMDMSRGWIWHHWALDIYYSFSFQVQLKDLAKAVGCKDLRFADSNTLLSTLGVPPGHVTVFALYNDRLSHSVKLLLDSQIQKHPQQFVNFHPMVNTATLGIKCSDLIKYLQHCRHDPHFVELETMCWFYLILGLVGLFIGSYYYTIYIKIFACIHVVRSYRLTHWFHEIQNCMKLFLSTYML